MLIRKLLHLCLAFIFLSNLLGCVTSAASKWAHEKASAPKNYRKIIDVHPTAVCEDGNIKICVKLVCESFDCKEQHYMVSLPFNAFTSGKIKPKKKGLQKDILSIDPYLPVYSIPIEKPSNACVEIAEMTVPPESQIRIEKLYLPVNEWKGLYDGLPRNKEDIFAILKKYNDVVPSSGALYTINFVHKDLKPEWIFLAYFPEQDTDSGAHAIGILSGYNDKSTKAGYALIPLALIADLAIIAIVIAGAVVVIIGSMGTIEFK